MLEYFAEEGKFTTWTEPKEGKGEKVVLIDKIWKYLVSRQLLLGDNQNKETFKSILRDFKEVYEYLLHEEMLVIPQTSEWELVGWGITAHDLVHVC